MVLAQFIEQALDLCDIGGRTGRIDHLVAMGMGPEIVNSDRTDDLAPALASAAMVTDQSCDENISQLRLGHGAAYLLGRGPRKGGVST